MLPPLREPGGDGRVPPAAGRVQPQPWCEAFRERRFFSVGVRSDGLLYPRVPGAAYRGFLKTWHHRTGGNGCLWAFPNLCSRGWGRFGALPRCCGPWECRKHAAGSAQAALQAPAPLLRARDACAGSEMKQSTSPPTPVYPGISPSCRGRQGNPLFRLHPHLSAALPSPQRPADAALSADEEERAVPGGGRSSHRLPATAGREAQIGESRHRQLRGAGEHAPAGPEPARPPRGFPGFPLGTAGGRHGCRRARRAGVPPPPAFRVLIHLSFLSWKRPEFPGLKRAAKGHLS